LFLAWLIDPEGGSDMFLQNVRLSLNYTVPHPGRLYTPLWASNPTLLQLISHF
jgi:hypothetical protein